MAGIPLAPVTLTELDVPLSFQTAYGEFSRCAYDASTRCFYGHPSTSNSILVRVPGPGAKLGPHLTMLMTSIAMCYAPPEGGAVYVLGSSGRRAQISRIDPITLANEVTVDIDTLLNPDIIGEVTGSQGRYLLICGHANGNHLRLLRADTLAAASPLVPVIGYATNGVVLAPWRMRGLHIGRNPGADYTSPPRVTALVVTISDDDEGFQLGMVVTFALPDTLVAAANGLAAAGTQQKPPTLELRQAVGAEPVQVTAMMCGRDLLAAPWRQQVGLYRRPPAAIDYSAPRGGEVVAAGAHQRQNMSPRLIFYRDPGILLVTLEAHSALDNDELLPFRVIGLLIDHVPWNRGFHAWTPPAYRGEVRALLSLRRYATDNAEAPAVVDVSDERTARLEAWRDLPSEVVENVVAQLWCLWERNLLPQL